MAGGLKSGRRRLVWVTRAQPGADRTAARLRDLGFAPLVGPLLQVRPATDAVIDLAGVGAIAFTSANAARAFAALSSEREAPVFTVGDATAAAARAAGFQTVWSAKGDVDALAALIAARRGEISGAVLYASAAEPSRDLGAALEGLGVPVRKVSVYETVETAAPSSLLQQWKALDAVLIHSAKAGRALARILQSRPAPHLTAVCLSAQAAEPLRAAPLSEVVCAARPDEAALLERLRESAA